MNVAEMGFGELQAIWEEASISQHVSKINILTKYVPAYDAHQKINNGREMAERM